MQSEIRLIVSVAMLSTVFSFADQNGTCEMEGHRKAHYYCPDGYEIMLAGGGNEDCSGRCFEKGNSNSLKKAIQASMREDFNQAISDVDAQNLANEFLRKGQVEAKGGIILKKGEAKKWQMK